MVGLEADLAYADMRGNATGISVNGVKQQVEQDINWFGTVRGRIGILPTDRLLLFATGGVAYGGVAVSSNLGPSVGVCGPGNSCGAGFASGTNVGWTAGGGLEYAWTNQLSFKAEYLFVDLGNKSVTYPITLAVSLSTTRSTFEANIVRVGLNYKFAPGPAPARY